MRTGTPAQYILLPGRHHLLTRFQASYLAQLLAGGCADDAGDPIPVAPDATVVWAVTSANHQNTRRNPLPVNRREAAIERFSVAEGLRSLVIGVFDTRPSERFAEITLKNVENATAGDAGLTPANTVLACSTPAVSALYAALGFRVAPVEHGHPRLATPGGASERQSSSGVLVGTGTGATGWCRSIRRERACRLRVPAPTERFLEWFVREAWPSPATGTDLTEGLLGEDEKLAITAETDGLVVFGDGIETDRLTLAWGQRLDVSLAARRLRLVESA